MTPKSVAKPNDSAASVASAVTVPADERCLVPGCGKRTVSRGLCLEHYRLASRLVKLGRTSWAGLEKSGRVCPTARGNARRAHEAARNWFLDPTADAAATKPAEDAK